MEIGFIKIGEKGMSQSQKRVRMRKNDIHEAKAWTDISKFIKINTSVKFITELFHFPYVINIKHNNIFNKALRIFKTLDDWKEHFIYLKPSL